MSEIRKITFESNTYTAISIASSYEIPLSLLQKEREDCILVCDNSITTIPWYGVRKDTSGTYILLKPLEIEEIFSISTKYRSKALTLIRKIAKGIASAPLAFLDLFTGFLPLYRIYIVDGNDILLLPKDCSEILTLSRTNEEMDKNLRFLLSSDTEEDYRIFLELIELMYYAVTSRFPYEKSEVRLSGFKPYSITLYSDIPYSLSSFIMKYLLLGEKEQRKLFSGKDCAKNAEFFLDKTASLEWPLSSISNADRLFSLKCTEESPEFSLEKKKKEKKASRLSFIRKKGLVVLAILLSVAFISYFVINYLYQTFKPPLTKDMTCIEIIEYTIEKQNELDTAHISEGFKKEAAQEEEVRNLYILNKTRSAYEGKEPLVKISDYLEGKIESVQKDSIPYGVFIKEIIDNGNESYRAILEWYTPYGFSDDDELNNPVKDGFLRVFKYIIYEDFTFTFSSRGWWECTSSSFSSESLVDLIYIPLSQE